jgi:hypothetical protein
MMRQDDISGVCRRVGLFLVIGIFTGYALPVHGAGPEAQPYSDLGQIKKFVAIEVQVQGTAEKLGLKSADLTDATRLTFLKNFPGVALEMTGGPSGDGKDRLSQLGYLTCEVWTVGEDYVVAYHLDCNAGSYLVPRKSGTLWNRAILGYGPKEDIRDTVHGGLRSMVEQLSATFFKVRAEVRPQ